MLSHSVFILYFYRIGVSWFQLFKELHHLYIISKNITKREEFWMTIKTEKNWSSVFCALNFHFISFHFNQHLCITKFVIIFQFLYNVFALLRLYLIHSFYIVFNRSTAIINNNNIDVSPNWLFVNWEFLSNDDDIRKFYFSLEMANTVWSIFLSNFLRKVCNKFLKYQIVYFFSLFFLPPIITLYLKIYLVEV